MVSTAVSAVVGTLVSLAAVAQTTTRQRRAERRDAARQGIRHAVAPLRGQLRKYQARMLSSLKREEPEIINGDDYALVSALLPVAEELHPVRRWLVRRRIRRLFGPLIFKTADVAPMEGSSLGAIAPLLIAEYDPSKIGNDRHGKRFGLVQEALSTEPSSKALSRLERELRRLAAGW